MIIGDQNTPVEFPPEEGLHCVPGIRAERMGKEEWERKESDRPAGQTQERIIGSWSAPRAMGHGRGGRLCVAGHAEAYPLSWMR